MIATGNLGGNSCAYLTFLIDLAHRLTDPETGLVVQKNPVACRVRLQFLTSGNSEVRERTTPARRRW